ncbi:MAG: hypothetical protein JNK82_41735 [Myxococcaceae bacterium]|nr:hypothetical protein [Myxococcaceae bacterium]
MTLALVAMLPLSGCVIVSRSPGTITFLWSFEGASCFQMAQVANVQVEIAGQVLENGGLYPCSQNGTDGILLGSFDTRFRGGIYSYTVRGLDNQGRTLYQSSGSLTVDGNVTVNVNLRSTGPADTFAYLLWTFPPKGAIQTPTCADVGVTTVRLYIDGSNVPVDYPCAQGQSQPGPRTPNLSVGDHTVYVSAVDSVGYEYYGLSSTLPIRSSPVSSQYDLNWTVGGAAVRWTVMTFGGATSTTCGAEGITSVFVNFRDSQGNLLYPNSGDEQPCTFMGQLYDALPPGNYQVFLVARGTGNSLYESSRTNPPTVSVTAGVFRNINDGPNISLTRVQ